MFKFQNLRSQGLTKSQDGTTAKLIEIHVLAHILTNLIVSLDLTSLSQSDFLIFIFHLAISNNDTIAVNFKVTFIRINNHIEVFITTKNLSKHIAETFLQHAHQSCTVDILGFFELAKCINHTRS